MITIFMINSTSSVMRSIYYVGASIMLDLCHNEEDGPSSGKEFDRNIIIPYNIKTYKSINFFQ